MGIKCSTVIPFSPPKINDLRKKAFKMYVLRAFFVYCYKDDMIEKFDEASFTILCDKLSASDKVLAGIIDGYGYPPMWKRPNTFETFVHIILEQQVSLASALSALNKMREKVKDIQPENLLMLTDEEFRACYFSRQKTLYVKNLAEAMLNNHIDLNEMEKLPDDDIRSKFIKLKGIGNWTIDIYLMFVLQRTDIFPAGDLAAVNALKQLKKLPKETSKEELLAIAANWQPYRTIATMLLWHYYLSSLSRKKMTRRKQEAGFLDR